MENKSLPAFPVPENVLVHKDQAWDGLTKREYFAAMAMQGMAANSHEAMFMMKAAQIATTSVQLADALIAELEK